MVNSEHNVNRIINVVACYVISQSFLQIVFKGSFHQKTLLYLLTVPPVVYMQIVLVLVGLVTLINPDLAVTLFSETTFKMKKESL